MARAVELEQPSNPAESAYPAQILNQYPIARHAAVRTVPVTSGGFSGARIWRIESSGPALCLRQWPAAGLPRERIAGLHRLCAHVAAREMHCVPVPFSTRRGNTLFETGDRFWQLEPWMPGAADFEAAASRIRLDAALRCLADWHHAAATFVPRAAECRWFHSTMEGPVPAIAERIEYIDDWTAVRRSQAAQALAASDWPEFRECGLEILQLFNVAGGRIRDELAAASQLTVRLQPCLRDVWHDHLLFTGDRVTGLIDPGACRTDSVAADVSRLLGSLVYDCRDSWNFALDRYCQYHPLSAPEQMLVGLLDRSAVLLSGMTWLRWVLFEHRRWPAPERVIARLRRILDRLRFLVNGPAAGKFIHP